VKAAPWRRPRNHGEIAGVLSARLEKECTERGSLGFWRLFRPVVIDPITFRGLRRARIARVAKGDSRCSLGSERALAEAALELIDDAQLRPPDVKRWLDWKRDMWLAMHCQLRAWKQSKNAWRSSSLDARSRWGEHQLVHERVAQLWGLSDAVVKDAAERYARTAAQAIAEVASDGLADSEIVGFFANALRLSRRTLKSRCRPERP
jgi:hypothetical protein